MLWRRVGFAVPLLPLLETVTAAVVDEEGIGGAVADVGVGLRTRTEPEPPPLEQGSHVATDCPFSIAVTRCWKFISG